jgi:hypothetical protein
MKHLFLILVFLFSFSAEAQRRFDDHNPPPPGNPPPPVPLDGGLVALIGAGAALGYKKYKEHNKE